MSIGQKITIEIPPMPTWDIMEWCVLHNLKMDLAKESTVTAEVMNTITLKMWDIEERNLNWKNDIIPSLRPYRKKWDRRTKITPIDTSGGYITQLSVKILPL